MVVAAKRFGGNIHIVYSLATGRRKSLAAPYTINPKLNPKLYTLHPNPESLNLTP
jgi:hypothetical protein